MQLKVERNTGFYCHVKNIQKWKERYMQEREAQKKKKILNFLIRKKKKQTENKYL